MSGWNFDMSQAPRGRIVQTSYRNAKGVLVQKSAWKSPIIFVAYDGDQVGVTKWLEDEQRWNGFTKNKDSDAWLPYPTHPSTNPSSKQEEVA